MSKSLDYVRNWTNPDGSIRTTMYIKNAMNHGESEEDFIKRCDKALIESNPEYGELQSTLDHVNDLPDVKERERWRRDSNGKVFVDMKVKTSSEIFEEQRKLEEIKKEEILKKKHEIKKKLLKTNDSLTDEDVDLILGL